jgi:hypothetical protein
VSLTNFKSALIVFFLQTELFKELFERAKSKSKLTVEAMPAISDRINEYLQLYSETVKSSYEQDEALMRSISSEDFASDDGKLSTLAAQVFIFFYRRYGHFGCDNCCLGNLQQSLPFRLLLLEAGVGPADLGQLQLTKSISIKEQMEHWNATNYLIIQFDIFLGASAAANIANKAAQKMYLNLWQQQRSKAQETFRDLWSQMFHFKNESGSNSDIVQIVRDFLCNSSFSAPLEVQDEQKVLSLMKSNEWDYYSHLMDCFEFHPLNLPYMAIELSLPYMSIELSPKWNAVDVLLNRWFQPENHELSKDYARRWENAKSNNLLYIRVVKLCFERTGRMMDLKGCGISRNILLLLLLFFLDYFTYIP